MDPSAEICLMRDSFSDKIVEVAKFEEWYSSNEIVSLTDFDPSIELKLAIETISTDDMPEIVNCDIEKYNELQALKDQFETIDDKDFREARIMTNPFEHIGKSIFIDRAAVKLANIDAVLSVTKCFTFVNKRSDHNFTYCDIAAGPGAFTQYFQYRFPNSQGYGITLRLPKELDWNTKYINMSRFKPFYGSDNTGDLYKHWGAFNDFVLKNESVGVDLVTGDGGFTVEKSLLHKQEFLSSRLLFTQALVGIKAPKVGGNFVLKVFETVTELSAHLIYVLTLCFNKVTVFKPVSSRPANSERYIVCLGKKEGIDQYYKMLTEAAQSYSDKVYLNKIFDRIDPKFLEWLTALNNRSIDRQLVSVKNILAYINYEEVKPGDYDINKFLIIWNLPATPRNYKQSAIKIF